MCYSFSFSHKLFYLFIFPVFAQLAQFAKDYNRMPNDPDTAAKKPLFKKDKTAKETSFSFPLFIILSRPFLKKMLKEFKVLGHITFVVCYNFF
ncbi:hypothetical protein C5S35_16295 [Candidatus Methanophagaceae archaeon]|nr:hypothetical protein C5S35_16295 [Methanophagales archaeon]